LEISFVPIAKESSASSKQDNCVAHSPPPNQEGVVHHEFASAGQTALKEYYLQFMWCLCDTVCHKQPEKQLSGHGQIHQDNAPAHSSQLVQHFLAKHENLLFYFYFISRK
jgi:hypothetical protein